MFEELKKYNDLEIDWDLTPEHAVTMYLEWGNNDWRSEYPPVRSKADSSLYFVLDTWEPAGPQLRLVKRNSEEAVDLLSIPLPPELQKEFTKEFASLKGIFSPTNDMKTWLKKILSQQ